MHLLRRFPGTAAPVPPPAPPAGAPPRTAARPPEPPRPTEYLPASVGEFPGPAEFLKILEAAGFRNCKARSQSFGIAQIYVGER